MLNTNTCAHAKNDPGAQRIINFAKTNKFVITIWCRILAPHTLPDTNSSVQHYTSEQKIKIKY